MLGQVMVCLGTFLAYIIPVVLVVVPVRLFTRVPSFVFRKVLHAVAFTCVSVMILAAGSWQAAAIASLVTAAAVYPLLGIIESRPWYPTMFVEKKPGEVRASMLMLFLMFAGIVAVAWGVFGRPSVAAAAILMWGTGDAAAALVGIPLGHHKVSLPIADGKKSWEGSLAMLATSMLAGLVVLGPASALAVVAAALVGTITELFSPTTLDTVTVPVVIALVLLALP